MFGTPAPPAQPPAPPTQPVVPMIQPDPVLPLNWFHFKLEFTDKPDEDAEAHLLRTNDWMDTHAFPEGVKVQRLCLTLVGEAKLWYESLRPTALDWNGLQIQLGQQYSKIGNIREQLYHEWRSFHFDENSETLDSYVTHFRQVAALLGYGKPLVLEVFKNTPPIRLYWVLFPLEELGQAVEMAKRILTKEEIDRRLVSQSSSTPFVNIQDRYNNGKKVVSFDTQDR